MQNRLKKLGSRFLFEWTLELMHDTIVKGLQDYLKMLKPEDVPVMIREERFPPLERLDFSIATDNIAYLEKITAERFMEVIAEARPDLAKSIMDEGMAGAVYIIKLRQHLLERVEHPEKALAKSTEYLTKSTTMKLVTCERCGKSWPVPEDKVSALDKCPFCKQ